MLCIRYELESWGKVEIGQRYDDDDKPGRGAGALATMM